ncbi:PIN domain-containing protein [Kribbella sp. NBC_01510]|uniref:PIN domain-containing protein n=1 Tax=Kribbella sp. NBC_01510 TaxID=2903581 RepID=UPI00387095C9
MTESSAPNSGRPERAFLDANVIRGQQTNDILLSLADNQVFEPRWTQQVIDEMRRNRPPGLSEKAIDRRITMMNAAFEDAMTEAPPQELQDQMQADPKDKHVLAGAVASESDVLVTDNLKDFDPPSSGPNAMRVESLNQFLSRKLEEDPERVQQGMQDMLRGYRRDPRTMSALIDTMAEGQELKDFAKQLNAVVPPEQRGSSPALSGNQRGSAQYAALEGVARPGNVQAPTSTSEARKSTGQDLEKSKGAEQDV